jgi:Lhr-like helicase
MPAPFVDSPLTRWFEARFGRPTPVQSTAVEASLCEVLVSLAG